VKENTKGKAGKYDNMVFQHPVLKDWFGKYIHFEGAENFNNNPLSALYLIVKDKTPSGDSAHYHDFDEYLSFVALDPEHPDDLGAEVEIFLGKEKESHRFNKSTSFFIPKGFVHAPVIFHEVSKPFLLVHLFLTPTYTRKE
jgi:hypothetical protein